MQRWKVAKVRRRGRWRWRVQPRLSAAATTPATTTTHQRYGTSCTWCLNCSSGQAGTKTLSSLSHGTVLDAAPTPTLSLPSTASLWGEAAKPKSTPTPTLTPAVVWLVLVLATVLTLMLLVVLVVVVVAVLLLLPVLLVLPVLVRVRVRVLQPPMTLWTVLAVPTLRLPLLLRHPDRSLCASRA